MVGRPGSRLDESDFRRNNRASETRFCYTWFLAIVTEDQKYVLRRVAILFVLALFVGRPATTLAQTLPGNWHIDWSVKLEYLFGTQRIREAVSPNYVNSWPDRVTVDYNPGFWLITGLSEVSPLQRVSVRLSGSTNIPYSDQDVARLAYTPLVGPILGGVWPAKTTFVSLEAAGAYHFADDGLYRLSVCAGYRHEWWRRAGEAGSNVLRDKLDSSIPFLGLQAQIFLPGWRGRFEVMGSPFMNTAASISAASGASYSDYSFNVSRGGRVEARLCGESHVTTRLLWGITAEYRFEALYGPISGVINGVGQGPYDGYLEQSIGQVGLHFTWIM